ncbi:MAG: hypothetical protein ACK47B_27995 [Armatimonadota bacterium]
MPESTGKLQRSQIARRLREARHSAREVVGSIRFCVEDPHVGLREIVRSAGAGDTSQLRKAAQRCDHIMDHVRKLEQHLETLQRLEQATMGEEPAEEETA